MDRAKVPRCPETGTKSTFRLSFTAKRQSPPLTRPSWNVFRNKALASGRWPRTLTQPLPPVGCSFMSWQTPGSDHEETAGPNGPPCQRQVGCHQLPLPVSGNHGLPAVRTSGGCRPMSPCPETPCPEIGCPARGIPAPVLRIRSGRSRRRSGDPVLAAPSCSPGATPVLPGRGSAPARAGGIARPRVSSAQMSGCRWLITGLTCAGPVRPVTCNRRSNTRPR